MQCLCEAYANPKWKNCLVCGNSLRDLNGLSWEEIKKAAGQDWEMLKSDKPLLNAFISALLTAKQREQGRVPTHYTAKTRCKHCGEVPIPPALVNGGFVLGCPWCFMCSKEKNFFNADSRK